MLTPERTMLEIHSFSEDRISNAEIVGNAVASSETGLYSVSPLMSFPTQGRLEAVPDFRRRP